MKLQNSKLRAGLITSLTALFVAASVTSCKQEAQVTPQTNETTSPSNSMDLVNTTSSLSTTRTSSAPISYYSKNNITISGLSISGGSNCIALYNCNNVHITNCKLANATSGYGIMLNNCTNITVDYNYITNVRSGVHVYQGSAIKVNNNQFLNMIGPFPYGNFVQFASVSGGGNQINNNRCEDKPWVGHPQDGISLYKSNGKLGDSIQVMGNWIRGGQVQHDSGGGAGIVLGDVGGSYQVARWNKLVNPGFVGAQVQGGSHIKMDHNTVYSSSTAYSNCGVSAANYSGTASWDVNVSYNWIKYYQTSGAEWDIWLDKSLATPAGWYTNYLKANISSSILPSTIITMQ